MIYTIIEGHLRALNILRSFLWHNWLSVSILDCIFLHHLLEMELILIREDLCIKRLNWPLIEVTTIEELSLGWPKGGRGSLIEKNKN